MKRTWTGLLAAVLSVGCVTGLEDGSTDDHGMEITISGGDLRSTFALVDGYFESPVMAVPEGATRVAVHRLRKRFREHFRSTIADTVDGVAEVDDEVRYVARVLGEA